MAPPFLTSALDGGEWSSSRLCRFTPADTHWIGGWVGPRVCLDSMEKRQIWHCRKSNPGRPARSQLNSATHLFHNVYMCREINVLISETSGTASDVAAMQDVRLDIGDLKRRCVSELMRRFYFPFWCRTAPRIPAAHV
jgi:hypothetical protein